MISLTGNISGSKMADAYGFSTAEFKNHRLVGDAVTFSILHSHVIFNQFLYSNCVRNSHRRFKKEKLKCRIKKASW